MVGVNLDPVKSMFEMGNTCVRVVTYEEGEVLSAGIGLMQSLGLTPWVWSSVQGVRAAGGVSDEAVPKSEHPAAALTWAIGRCREPIGLITLDLGDRLDDAPTLRALRELIENFRVQGRALASQNVAGDQRRAGPKLLMIDHRDAIPPSIGAVSVRHTPALPDDAALAAMIKATARRLHQQGLLKNATIDGAGQRRAVEVLRGLTLRQAEQLIREACADGKLENADLDDFSHGKRRLMEDSGVLEFVDAPTSLEDIGGLERLKRWLRTRESSFDPKVREATGLTPPRGVLLLGVQGAGKSLASKAIATAWKRPLMRLDPSSLFDRFVGESERRLRDALSQAEAMAPIVLWIDEIEKGFASAASASVDGGLSRRMFGTLLTWMQEHRAPVFMVATANDIAALPPELLRKGRFDEIFFVDLPSREVRRTILEIHLRKRRQAPASLDLDALATACEGFSGSEIEQAILSALHEAANDVEVGVACRLTTECLMREITQTKPLSVTMRERISELRAWARERCVMAD